MYMWHILQLGSNRFSTCHCSSPLANECLVVWTPNVLVFFVSIHQWNVSIHLNPSKHSCNSKTIPPSPWVCVFFFYLSFVVSCITPTSRCCLKFLLNPYGERRICSPDHGPSMYSGILLRCGAASPIRHFHQRPFTQVLDLCIRATMHPAYDRAWFDHVAGSPVSPTYQQGTS